MTRTTIPFEQRGVIALELVGATLSARGWERDEVRLETRDGDKLKTEETKEGLRIRCKENLKLWVPQECSLTAEKIGGTASVANIHGNVSFERVGGTLTVKDSASLKVERCGGSLVAKNINGSVEANSIGGSATVKSVAGDVILSAISGSTNLRGIEGNVAVKAARGSVNMRDAGPDVDVDCRGNASLHFSDAAEGMYRVEASGNVFCNLRGTQDATVSLQSGSGKMNLYSSESIEALHSHDHQLVLGKGTGMLEIKAGGSITLDTHGRGRSYSFDFDFGDDLAEEFETIADDITEQISGQVENQLDELNAKLDHLRLRLQSAGSSTQSRLRKAERRLNTAQRRLQRKLERQSRPRAGAYAAKKAEPVSEAERLSVLQMVQEKRITVEEAELLLNALEGRPANKPNPPQPTETAEPPEAPEPPN